jgi:CRP/FNR family transcriptional regulator, anaerobic regulatory protein
VAGRGETPCLKGYWTGRVNCGLCGVPDPMPFKSLAARPRPPDLRAAESYILPAGATIIMAGDAAAAAFSIREGFIKLWRRDDAGQCRIVRLMRPGDMLGLEGTFQPVYQLSAATLSPAKLCRIPVELLTTLKEQEPVVYREVERRWHGHLAHADELAMSVVTGPSRQRVLKLLRFMAKFAAPDPCPRIRRLDMAAMLDISSETAARVIADLKHTGLLIEDAAGMHFDPDTLALADCPSAGRTEKPAPH